MMEVVVDVALINNVLYYLAFLSLPHITKSRYPFEDSGHEPSKLYNKQLPVVNKLPELNELFGVALDRMGKTYPELL